MKKTISRVMAFVFAFMMLTSSVSAVSSGVRSSLYLDAYRAWLTPQSGGEIDVNIDVQAVDDMDDVGAISVKIYESADGGNTWDTDAVYTSALFPELLVQNDYWYYDTPITHEGTAGYKYYAVVKVYAGDSTGSDTKSYVTATVTARN